MLIFFFFFLVHLRALDQNCWCAISKSQTLGHWHSIPSDKASQCYPASFMYSAAVQLNASWLGFHALKVNALCVLCLIAGRASGVCDEGGELAGQTAGTGDRLCGHENQRGCLHLIDFSCAGLSSSLFLSFEILESA